MAATTTSPVKILLDLGYEIWEMEKDGYRSALMESINDLTRINPRDGRIAILIQALKNLKRAPDKPKINISKVLNKRITGADIKPADVDDSSTSSALVPDRLSNVADSLDSIALLLRRQLGVEKKQQRDDKKKQDKDNKDARENKLEKKPDKKTGLIPKAIAKPTLNFFEKLKTFFLNIAIGSAVYKMLDWLKDPDNAEKISKFSDFLINNAGWILGGLAALALLPVVGGLVGLVGGIMGGISLLMGVGPALVLVLKGLILAAIAALAVKVGKKALEGTENLITGGSEFTEARKQNRQELDAVGLDIRGRVKEDGKILHANVYGSNSITGREAIPGKENKNQRVQIDLHDPKHRAWYAKNYSPEALEVKVTALDKFDYNKANIMSEKKSMEEFIKEDNKRLVEERNKNAPLEKDLFGRKSQTLEYRTETENLLKENEARIRNERGQKVLDIQKNSSSATIDNNLKKETNISPPNTKGKGSTTIIDGGGGQQQSVGGGGGGINGTTPPSFPSQDPNNLGTFSTQGMYNMVG